MGGKNPEMLPFETDAMQVYATFSGEMADGSEGLFGCGTTATLPARQRHVVRRRPIRAFLMLPFNHLGSIGMNKRFHERDGRARRGGPDALGVVAQFDYGDGEQPISGTQDFSTFDIVQRFHRRGRRRRLRHHGGGGVWDASVWGTFYWSTAYQGMAEADIAGAGRNISLIIASPATQVEQPHTLQSYAIRWSASRAGQEDSAVNCGYNVLPIPLGGGANGRYGKRSIR
jgi:hypothetical protein